MMSHPPCQINSYCRGVLVRAIDPMTRGRLRERMGNDHVHTAHMRSFLDPPTPRGHTIKGYGRVNYKENRKNSTTRKMTFSLHRACDRTMAEKGVDPANYNYGDVTTLDRTAIVSINGRRSVERVTQPRLIIE